MTKRIAVLGSGANGASIGADLTAAGLDVTLIEQWPAHVEAMRRPGSPSGCRTASCTSTRAPCTCARSQPSSGRSTSCSCS